MVIITKSFWKVNTAGIIRHEKSCITPADDKDDAVLELTGRKEHDVKSQENPYKVVSESFDDCGNLVYVKLESVNADKYGEKQIKVLCVAETFADKCDLLCSC